LQQSTTFSQDWVDAVEEKKTTLASFGATLIEHEFSENASSMTHVILSDCVEQIESSFIPAKHQQKQEGMYFVKDTWLEDSIKHWQCLNELEYAIDESLFTPCHEIGTIQSLINDEHSMNQQFAQTDEQASVS
jgi:hypothetical protein